MIDKESIDKLAGNIEQHAFRRGYVSAFTLAAYPVEQREELTLHITRECDGLVYGNAEVATIEAFKACVTALDGRVDYIVYDTALDFDMSEFTRDGKKRHGKSVILPYSDKRVWVESVRYTLLALIPDLPRKKVVVIGRTDAPNTLAALLTAELAGYCGSVRRYDADAEYGRDAAPKKVLQEAEVVIGAAIYTRVIAREQLEICRRKPIVMDAGIGTLTPDAAEYAREKGLRMIRVDNRAAMAGMLVSLIQSHDLVTRVMGSGKVNGVPVVAGGIIGAPGTIVVDSIDQPSIAIGFADGTGRIRYQPANAEEAERMRRVTQALGQEGSHG